MDSGIALPTGAAQVIGGNAAGTGTGLFTITGVGATSPVNQQATGSFKTLAEGVGNEVQTLSVGGGPSNLVLSLETRTDLRAMRPL